MKSNIPALLLAIALAAPAFASDMPSGVTMENMLKWKVSFLAKYEKVTYLSEDQQPLTESNFFHRVVDEQKGFKFNVDSAASKQIVIRILNNDEEKVARSEAN
jgi:hypothetical protein